MAYFFSKKNMGYLNTTFWTIYNDKIKWDKPWEDKLIQFKLQDIEVKKCLTTRGVFKVFLSLVPNYMQWQRPSKNSNGSQNMRTCSHFCSRRYVRSLPLPCQICNNSLSGRRRSLWHTTSRCSKDLKRITRPTTRNSWHCTMRWSTGGLLPKQGDIGAHKPPPALVPTNTIRITTSTSHKVNGICTAV